MRAKKWLGQHFLHDASKLKRIANKISEFKLPVIEVGPGSGRLTNEILKLSIDVKAVEVDQDLQPTLSLLQQKYSNLTIIYKDIMKYSWPDEQYIIAGNLPYNISVPLIMHLAMFVRKPCVFLVQKEVAQRLAAKISTSEYGRPSVIIQSAYDVILDVIVPATCFYPKPKVTSQVIICIPKENLNINWKKLDQLLKHAFSTRRKQIANSILKKWPVLSEILQKYEEYEKLRAQDIPVKIFQSLSNLIT